MTTRPLATVPEFPRRLVYLGTPAMAVPPLQALVSNGFDIALVVSGPDRRRGRGKELSPSPVKAAALALDLTVSDRVEDAVEVGADLGVVVAYGSLVRRPVLEQVPMVNIHFSLLPRWRGAAPVERAILAGDLETGTCLMQLEEGLDTGPVFDTVRVPIRPRATADEVRHELVDAGVEQLLRCLGSGLGNPEPQTGEPTYASKIRPEELRIDWDAPAVVIDRLVRLGAAWTSLRGRRLRIHAAVPDGAATAKAPGSLDGLRVTCGDGQALVLEMVQPEGKAAMDARSWAHGARPTEGELLGH